MLLTVGVAWIVLSAIVALLIGRFIRAADERTSRHLTLVSGADPATPPLPDFRTSAAGLPAG
jgi:hypothetical protein